MPENTASKHERMNGPITRRTVSHSNSLYEDLCADFEAGDINAEVFQAARAALMLLESLIVPDYAFFSPDDAMGELVLKMKAWDDLDIPF